ncbi:potassium transporter Trk [Microbacterium sp. CPCC 204701]|uniref:potassium transporter Trk n=1 Tax=Microbacterium sp. CPCC 204701 TaxID=2493084 RepID=UPI000FD9856F|nr:potassium transporter Trk [Microbacterium sp. CPCC 204701]
MPEHSQDHIETVRVRRAPKISVFLIAGAALGVLVAMILTFAFDGSAEASPNTGVEYSQGQVFGFLVLVCAPIGIALAGTLALILDRRSQRRTHDVAVDHASVHVDPEPGTNGHGPGH